jgi:hypothetical protein
LILLVTFLIEGEKELGFGATPQPICINSDSYKAPCNWIPAGHKVSSRGFRGKKQNNPLTHFKNIFHYGG